MFGIRGISMSAAAVLILAAAACTHSSSPAAATTSPASASPASAAAPVDVATVLSTSVRPLQQLDYAFSMTMPDLTAKGVVDHDSAAVTVVTKWDSDRETDTADLVVIGANRYLRLGIKSKDFDQAKANGDPAARLFDRKIWFKVDPKKLKSDSLNLYLTDVTGILALVRNSVADTGTARQLTGHVSLPPSLPGRRGLLDPKTIVLEPFTATFDPQGDLLSLGDIKKPSHWGFTFTGYDKQQRPTAPAGARTLPASMYEVIND